ncbi:ATP-dependent helicase [Vibrio parahaemolyticus O3:K56]|uniref:UvrD-helicase domain-containing protein n=1 Tax=Vibrio parahaemolyticus TaxID=670 RepID=UPI00044B6E05|nr:ATP-dependent helicase [Vibrio parahaemolyticus]EJG0871679.1 ATP-dependent helicase [Vibrio parahaemolyticus O3]EJG0900338.1 ATP-dependent helicase [Vibrio parahaemolyticus O3:K56]EII3144993.1 ATP-dependent helicase [Vibrio parahaemolyticus]EKZ9208793.1 ATP-dependent helicase [Vibrio parahaemolyticus]EXJ46369.1 uvrD/REP helicase N-terminal domain protein [Vibrio parahaemolyticus VPTS-2010]
MRINTITSESVIKAIDDEFRVSAGPGAGKTHWLISHISNVVSNSTRLGKFGKVACITYTNIAADTINSRLGDSSQNTEVRTLHSFLYRHIIKPYASFLPSEYELSFDKIDGHDDHYVSLKRINDWLNNHKSKAKFKHPYTIKQLQKLKNNQEALSNWIGTIYWSMVQGENLELKCKSKEAFYIESGRRKYISNKIIGTLSEDLITYKKIFWRKGILHHDDVLYFSYKLIEENPFILTVMKSKFPYIFIDEFQDTSPIQSKIISKLKAIGVTVGVIGDKAQSIYGFQGATPNDFDEFISPKTTQYTISQNRRSTSLIIDVLNHIRKDIKQTPYRKESGILPQLLVGPIYDAYEYLNSNVVGGEIKIISRDNISVYNLNRIFNGGVSDVNPIDEIRNIDSNTERKNKVINCITALFLANNFRFKDAVDEIEKNFREISDEDIRKKMALDSLFTLTANLSKFEEENIYDFFVFIKDNIHSSISKLTDRGKQKPVYERILYKDIINQLCTGEETGDIKTIHKTKGDDFDNVLVHLPDEKKLDFLINPDLENNEEHRVYYVAVSRAKDGLFISVPTLNSKDKEKLSSLFKIVYL